MRASIVRWWVGLAYWLVIALAPAYAGGCAALGPGIEAATDAARGVCRAIARDWAPEFLAMFARLIAVAEGDCACPAADGSGSGPVSP
jgi:hypothetical protein